MKHLNPRQGITTFLSVHRPTRYAPSGCETPKSPPGDYNSRIFRDASTARACVPSVKHLNPRQGITTHPTTHAGASTAGARCETPKSPPGDYNAILTTDVSVSAVTFGVKHLNPRQGITTSLWRSSGVGRRRSNEMCETPKSPPGDYNVGREECRPRQVVVLCETPKSPPGDYNSQDRASRGSPTSCAGVKHLNPRQGITTLRIAYLQGILPQGVKHLNPRQGITTCRSSICRSFPHLKV